MTTTFSEFVDGRDRQSITSRKETVRQLEVVKRILKHGDFQIGSHLAHRLEPFLYVYNPEAHAPFGLRIYKVGDDLCYRLQKKEKTEPYGRARTIDLEAMYQDVQKEAKDDDEAAQEIIKALNEELKTFLKKSVRAEKQNKRRIEEEKPQNFLGGDIPARGAWGSDTVNGVYNAR